MGFASLSPSYDHDYDHNYHHDPRTRHRRPSNVRPVGCGGRMRKRRERGDRRIAACLPRDLHRAPVAEARRVDGDPQASLGRAPAARC